MAGWYENWREFFGSLPNQEVAHALLNYSLKKMEENRIKGTSQQRGDSACDLKKTQIEKTDSSFSFFAQQVQRFRDRASTVIERARTGLNPAKNMSLF